MLTLFWQGGASGLVEVRLGDTLLYAGDAAHGTLLLGALASGEALVDRYDLRVPADFGPGAADLTVSVGGVTATLTALDVQAVERVYMPPAVATLLDAVFADRIALAGYTLTPGAEGAATTLALSWQALAALPDDYTVFVHLTDAAGQPVTQQDAQPRGGAYPTSLWQPGEYVTDTYTFDLPPGDYVIEVGLYLPETGARLRLADGTDALGLPGFTLP